ncbi:hypothetical protein LAZ67_6001761 [Cordylochernes scorpioides]|uniref:Reverse transcriptase n=1 Tax=Cordylochernes scorpioides TaxID=51811 RepID=A0ABY6KJB9_9ARAC|nr:hypothetical protein LAZ67_6001761 [Cordylochernes scorpioides]
MGEFAFSDGRREAFILLHEGVRLETLPARLTIQSKGDTLSAFLSFGIKCSKCGRQGHRRASCPSLARRNFDAPKRVDNPAQVQAASPSPTVPKRTGPPTPVSSPPAPPAPSEEAPNNAPVTPAAAAPGAPALHPARPLLPPGEAPSSTCSASNPPTTPALPSPAPVEPMEVERIEEEGTGSTQEGRNKIRKELDACLQQAPSTIFDKTNQEGLEKERVCRLLVSTPLLKKQLPNLKPAQRTALYELVEALLQTNTHHLDGAQDLCLGYDAITAPPDAISGSGLACIYAPGVTVSRHRILWPGHIVLAAFNVHGQEMTVINVHLSHDQRERIEQLRVIGAATVEEEEEAWVLGDFNIRDDRNRDSISMAALGALCESAALLDAAPEFDAAHLPTRVAAHGDLIESSRLDRILAPARFLEVSTSYAIAPFHLSDHRMVLLRVGPPAAPYQPRVAATLRSGLAQENMNNYLVDIAEEISMLDAPQLWDRWTLIKAGILAEARSLHDPRHHDRDDSYIGRAQRYIRVQLEASSTNADYPSLSDLARLTRHRRPAVTTIKDENGEVIEGPVLRRKALDIFRPRFARPSCDPAEYAAFIRATTTTPIELGEEDPLHRAEVSEAEVAAAIRRLPRGRAPGWDGLPCEVLSTFEEFFAVALRRVLAESQLRGALPPSMRRSEICLVPKARGGDRGLDGYRPISLPSADYRVIGSILLGRLRPHLPTLVPECQTYAVPGRSPSWNIARVTDAVEEATARGTPLAAVSVDLQSAFDSLDRGYLTSLLVSDLRLPPAFVGWILLLYAGADATIRVGGFQTVAFKLLNGVRQGCALSAALFSIATGPLLRRLETILGVGNVIAYADDIVLLIHRDEQFARAAAIFESFHRASGIAVNYSKSAGLWCGAWRDRGDSPLRGASWSNSSIQVLGTRIATRSSVVQREQHLLALLESACRRTTPFTRGLSLVGRARAANSLVLSTIQHHLHAYLPEASIISKLQARVARFIWGPDHTAWLASGILARPVVTGGLGLIDIGTQLHLACLPTAFKFGTRKSPGPDGIDNTIVKALVRGHGALLTRLYNRCMELGRFPRAWKAARIALLDKSGRTGATAKDYRPVSLLSCLGKVLDSLLAQRLTRWLESGGHLSSSQHGFRRGRSTTTCLEEILGKIETGTARGDWVIAISLDISGAFDNLNWNTVVHALDAKGCPFNLANLVRDFLRDRRVSIKVGAVEIHRILSKGCPQGSCCGPILWNIVADTILCKELPVGSSVVAYADDTYLIIKCLKGVQVALRGGRNGFSWLVTSEAWLRPPPDGTTLQPRRLRLLKLWEETSGVLSLDHRAAPTTQLLDLPIIGGFRFLRPPNLLAPSRWVGARVRDLGDDDHHTIVTPHPTRSALADAAALAAFCRRIVAENIQASYRVPSLAEAVVLRGTTKPLARITTRSARRALDRPRLAALPIHRLLARWTPTVDVPPRVDWTSLRRGALSGHNADVALRLALHALPHPDHPASAGPSCPACGSSDGSLGHRYWGCRTIRPLILEAFNIIGRPPDLQAWIFGTGLEQDDISILSSAKSRVYRHFIQVGLLGSAEDPVIAWHRTLARWGRLPG